MKPQSNTDLEIKTSTHLASVEIVMGSLGHGFKLPFTGTFLSFYQLFICLELMLLKNAQSISVFNISVIVALLKTVSPFGKKLTPMLAIASQGFLLWLGSVILGETLIGVILGSILFVSWSLLQMAIGYTILYGFDFFKMIEFVQQEIGESIGLNVYIIILSYWFLRVFVAIGIIVFFLTRKRSDAVWSFDKAYLKRIQTRFMKSRISTSEPVWKKIVRDLFNPFFFLSLILMSVFHFYKDSSVMNLIWFICRSLAIGFLLIYLMRARWVPRTIGYCFRSSPKFRRLFRKMSRVRRQMEQESQN